MTALEEVALVGGMALVTFAVRYPVLALVGKLRLPDFVLRALRYVPPAVLTAIIVPGLLYSDERLNIGIDNSFLVAGIVATLVSWRTKNLLLTIVIGLAALWAWQALVPPLVPST